MRCLSYVVCLLVIPACQGQGEPPPISLVQHLVVVIQENHTFDNHFGAYCTAPAGSNPSCTSGPACCEAVPKTEPSGASPIVLDDAAHGAYDPVHLQDCELKEMNGGKMDKFVTGTACSDPQNFAVAAPALVQPYWALAGQGALADRYFQPIVGQSSANDMFFARAGFVFTDNAVVPGSIGADCGLVAPQAEYADPTIGDLLDDAGASWAFYAEGYQAQLDAHLAHDCAAPAAACPAQSTLYPCVYDPSDNPFNYYPTLRDRPSSSRDLARFASDLANGQLPQVSFVKALGFRTEHPGSKTKLSDGVAFVSSIVDEIARSPYASDTLVLVTYDEGGGYFDHVAPPPSPDEHAYGTRVPLLALGPFAKVNAISHAQLEHSSIVRFIEWNWLNAVGQLGTRDGKVGNLGSLLDASKTGVAVPE